jgi:hypothetical protein
MAIQCPFCLADWYPEVLLQEPPPAEEGLYEAGLCECGAWWYEGMEDVTEASVSTKGDVEDD